EGSRVEVMLTYRIDMTPDDNETVLITAPAFPELTTFAASPDEAMSIAADALEEALAARIADGRDIPASDAAAEDDRASWIQLSSLTSIKAALYQLMKVQGITRAELQRRLGWHREQVDRL